MQKLEVALRGASDFFIILFKKKNARAQRAPSNASPAYSSARSFCKSHLLSRYVSLALLLSVSLAQCISILLFRLFSLQVDPVRTNPPQSVVASESLRVAAGRFPPPNRNLSPRRVDFLLRTEISPPGGSVSSSEPTTLPPALHRDESLFHACITRLAELVSDSVLGIMRSQR